MTFASKFLPRPCGIARSPLRRASAQSAFAESVVISAASTWGSPRSAPARRHGQNTRNSLMPTSERTLLGAPCRGDAQTTKQTHTAREHLPLGAWQKMISDKVGFGNPSPQGNTTREAPRACQYKGNEAGNRATKGSHPPPPTKRHNERRNAQLPQFLVVKNTGYMAYPTHAYDDLHTSLLNQRSKIISVPPPWLLQSWPNSTHVSPLLGYGWSMSGHVGQHLVHVGATLVEIEPFWAVPGRSVGDFEPNLIHFGRFPAKFGGRRAT